MDKNKNRTDLLAAGRKKLQQFRQKKDGKGNSSQGKSSKKSGKSEQHECDVGAESVAMKPTVLLLSEGESATNIDFNLGVIDSKSENSWAPEIDVAPGDMSLEAIIPESAITRTPLAHDAELLAQEPGVSDVAPSGSMDGESTRNVDAEEARPMPLATIGNPVLDRETKDADLRPQEAVVSDVASSFRNERESNLSLDAEEARAMPLATIGNSILDGEAKHTDMSSIADVSTTSRLVDTTEGGIVTVKMNNASRKERLESSASHEVALDTTSFQARGYQEADGSGLKQFDRSSEPELEGDGKSNLSELHRTAANLEESAFGVTGVRETTHEEKPSSSAYEVPAFIGADSMSDGLLASALDSQEADGISAVGHQVINPLKNEVPGLPNVEKSEMLPAQVGNDWYRGVAEADNQHYMPEGSLMTDGKDQERSFEKEMVLSPGVVASSAADGCSISLSQLKEIVWGLSEDEFRSLLNSRGSFFNVDKQKDSLVLPEYAVLDLFERLKEELYITNFTKDIFYLQITEISGLQMEFDHHRHLLDDELSLLRASLNEVQEKRECLAEELTNCRSELQAVASRKEDLEDQVHSVKAEAQEFSARVHELQNSLEKSLGDLSSLSMELGDCKGLVASLRVENENLSGTLASMKEDRKKLVEEKESFLHENEKLSLELAECKSFIAALQVENSNLSGIHTLVTQERKKLEEEKESVADENEKMHVELTDCKGLVATLRDENAELYGSLSLVMEERMKLEEEKESLAVENEKLSMELTDCEGLVAALRVENGKLNGSLALVTGERKKLEEEKESLAGENEKMSMELTDCKGLVAALQDETAELKESLAMVTNERRKLEEKKELLAFEIEKISMELADCKGLVAALQVENASLKESLAMSIEERTKLEGDRELFVQENKRLSKELLVSQEKLPTENGEIVQDGGIFSPVLKKPTSHGSAGGSTLELLEIFDDSSVLVVLKGRLEEAENILENLEKAIEIMHSESTWFNRSSNKVSSPGVSKLIQAFESKVQHDDDETEDKAMTENQSVADPFMLIKEQRGKLRTVLQQLHVDAENAKEELGKISNLTVRKFKIECEALREISDNLEATNIELGVMYEALRQQASGLEAKNDELWILVEHLKQQDLNLKAEYCEVVEKVNEYESRINELLSQLHDLQRSSDEKTLMLECEVESLQKEASERTLILKRECNSTITQIIKTVERLNKFIGTVSTSTISGDSDDGLDANSRIAASVNATIKVIEDMQEKLETAHADCETFCSSFKEVNEMFNDMLRKNESASVMVHTLYSDLRKLVIDSCGSMHDELPMDIQVGSLSDPIDYIKYKTIVEQLEKFLSERLELQYLNNELNSELISRTKDIEEFGRSYLNLNTIQKLIEDVESVVKVENAEIDLDKTPALHLESLVSSLVRRYKEAGKQGSSSREEFGSMETELTELQEKIYQSNALNLQYETEILVLKASLRQAEEALAAALSELQDKVSELEQSEQRVSSIREKLSIAVSKGKGLVVQRDGLKQSLAEISKGLEECTQELQVRDARLHELETKLKTYIEAGEHAEALESELSYIRNSATALRESFLLKDSVLQRVEEILEDLDLPEQFHSRDIIEKVDWLARSATGSSLPVTDWDQKSSVVGYYSDAGFVTDAWKEDGPSNSSLGDDITRKYEDLQSKFYGLAEQNEMLEQSLMERNHLVKRWEELLDRINMPSQLRSMEPEDRIEWLGTALLEANHDRNSLQQKVDNLEDYCRSITADLEESQKRISELEADIQAVIHEREHLSGRMKILTFDHEKVLEQVVQSELDKEKLWSEMTDLQEKLKENVEIEEHINSLEGEISRLKDLVCDALPDTGEKELVAGESSAECLEVLLGKLIEHYSTLSMTKAVLEDAVGKHRTEEADANLDESTSRDVLVNEEVNVAGLKNDLDHALHDLISVKEERDTYMDKQQSLVLEIAALDKKREELQELLTQEQQKSVSLREKLNVAVRKGKSLVQQRDSLKQALEEMTNKLEHLKSEISHRENAVAEYEQKIRDLSTYPEMVEALESERLLLRNGLMETEHLLQEREHILNVTMNALGGIDVGGEVTISDPVEKLEQIGKQFRDLHAALASSEQESRKSRRAAELLLAELNEVQERNDILQEELQKAAGELSGIFQERDAAEAAKLEALSHLERLSAVFSEGKQKQYAELMVLKTGVDELKKGFCDIDSLVADVFSKDIKLLHNLEAYIESCLKQGDATDVVSLPILSAHGGNNSSNSGDKDNILFMDSRSGPKVHDHVDDSVIIEVCNSVGSTLQELKGNFDVLREKLHKHPKLLHDKANNVFNVMEILSGELTSQKKSFEALKRDITRLESIEKEKDSDAMVLRRNIALLYKACANSIKEIENRKTELVGGHSATIVEGLPFGGQTNFSSEEFIKAIADKLLLTLKDFAIMKTEFVESNLKEMKITIANMQRELQEKDIQKDRICMELVNQIKEAEAAARSYSLDLQSTQIQIHDMEQQRKVMEEERSLLEERFKVLQDERAALTESKDRVRSLSDVVAAKDQEIEALTQALEEEEIQMEEMKNKLEELEKVVQQKNLDLESLEAARGKIAKRLSVTVNKFDELHYMSETLLSEVENLQAQLQDRDAEISFLRQEVTRCTNDALVASQTSNKKDFDEIQEYLSWFDTIFSQDGVRDMHVDKESSQIHEYKEILQRKVSGIISEFEDLRAVAQSRDALLQVERNKVQELTRREEILQNSLREKEAHINMLEDVGDSGQATGLTSEILEVEPVVNKWDAPGPTTTSQVRSLRKVNNNDQVAIDMEPGGASGRLEDEDDDKVHGFKSLATSRIIPRFTRPITDMIDGLWVSCDRALMRQPALRLSIILYWAVLHTLLAGFVF